MRISDWSSVVCSADPPARRAATAPTSESNPMPPVACRASKAAIAFILVTAMLDVLSMGIVIPVLPTLIEQFTGSNARAGIINGVFVALWALMQFLASPVIGSLSDQHEIGRANV